MIKSKIAVVIAALALTTTTQACDIDAARAAIQTAAVNADDASTAVGLDEAQIAADDAERAVQSAAVFLSDCDSN